MSLEAMVMGGMAIAMGMVLVMAIMIIPIATVIISMAIHTWIDILAGPAITIARGMGTGIDIVDQGTETSIRDINVFLENLFRVNP